MYTADFFRTKLGSASLASIAAMVAMIALTTQVQLSADTASLAQPSTEGVALVELA